MDEKEIQALLGASTGGGTNDLTTAEKMQVRASASMGQSRPFKNFVERNMQGLPIDTESGGVPFTIKFNVAVRDKPEQKLSYLQEVYGKGNARLADTGEPLIKVLDPDTGQPKEVKVDENRFTLSDLATLAANAPEMVGGAISMFGTRRIPFLGGKWTGTSGVARDVVAESVGSEVGGAGKDALVATADNLPVTSQILKERAKNIPANIAIGGVLEGGARALGIASPFSGARGGIEQQQAEARQYFRERFGLDVPMTAGEETGSQALKRVESTMGRLPGSSKQFRDIRSEKQDRLNRIQNRMLGLPEEATQAERLARLNEEGIGEEAVTALRSSIEPQQAAVESAAKGTQVAATDDVMALTDTSAMTSLSLQSAGKVTRELNPEKVGSGIRVRALAERSTFQAESSRLYEEMRKLPGGSDRIFQTGGLIEDAKKIYADLPPVTKRTEEPTGVLGPSGDPITKTVTSSSASKEFVPSDVVGRLKEIIDNPDTLRSLEDLKQMRTDVDNAIAQGEAIPGVQTHYLKRIKQSISGEMDRVASSMPDGQLKAAFEKANAYYKQNVGKFEDSSVARLFKDVESRGFVQDEDIVRNIGPTEYASFKKFLGEASPEFQALKRSIADTVLNAATPLSGGVIDGAALVQQLKGMRDKNRAVFDDIFGPQTRNFQQLADVLQVGNARVDEQKFRALMASGSPTGDAVRALVKEQKKLDSLYKSRMLKEITDKTVGDNAFDPAEFVNRFYDKASMRDIRAVVEQLHDRPELLEGIRRNVMEKVFYEAQRIAKDTDPQRLGRGEIFRPSNSSSLDKVFGDEMRKEKLESILGRQTYRDFEMLSKLLRGSEMTEAAFAGAGGLAAGLQVTVLVMGSPDGPSTPVGSSVRLVTGGKSA